MTQGTRKTGSARRRALPAADELLRAEAPPRQPRAVALVPAAPARGAVRQPVVRRSAELRPSGRERHDEKITVYVSAEELLELEHARLALRADHGLAVDRGRIVREALAIVLAELHAEGDSATLVQRLRGA